MTFLSLFSRSYDPAQFHVPYPEEPPASEPDEPLYASADSISGYEQVDTRKPGKADYGPSDYAQVIPRDQRFRSQPEGEYAVLDRGGIRATPALYEALPPRTPPRKPSGSPDLSTRSEQIYFELESPPKVPPKPANRPSEPPPEPPPKPMVSTGGGQKAQFSLVNAELKQRFANRSGS